MLEAIFNDIVSTVTVAGLTQWDKGQKLHIKGLSLPETIQVHFANKKNANAIVMVGVKEKDYVVVEIPDALLEMPYDFYAWIYLTNENMGKTIKTIILKVENRAKPQDFISENPDATDILSDVVNKINQNIKDNAEFKEDITEQQNQFETENEQKFNKYYEELKKISANFMSVEDVDRICGGEYDPIYDDYNAQSITQEELEKILV